MLKVVVGGCIRFFKDKTIIKKATMSINIVSVQQGKLSGKNCKTSNNTPFYAYKGIPYAKPPVGELRFSNPQEPDTWEGIRDGTQDCNICAQLEKETLQIIGDEDCLFLNVYTPNLPNSGEPLLPVMVFFHGGGFIFGSGTDDSKHGPDYLIEKNVVLVSINYRLGVLGFLNLDCKEAPGNMGLKDQVQALKWVQQNISHFNGDPNNVTIFGISAGGSSVEYLMISPMAKGLFHKAIAQSGSSLLHWAQNNKINELASKIPVVKKKIIDNKKDLIKYLKSLSFKELISAAMMVLAERKYCGGIYFGFVPSIEKEDDWEPFITKSTYDLLVQGNFTKVPYMAGFCAREGLLVVSMASAALEQLVKEKNFMSILPFEIDDTEKNDTETRLKTVYLEGENVYKEEDEYAVNFYSDIDFIGGIYVSTKLIAKNNSKVYFYEFAYDGGLNYLKKKLNINRKGACHGDDGGYLVKSNILKDDNLSETDRLVLNRMCLMWTNFAKFGDPTPSVDNVLTTKWEPITETGLACLVIDDKLTMKYQVETERMRLFEELYEKYYKS